MVKVVLVNSLVRGISCILLMRNGLLVALIIQIMAAEILRHLNMVLLLVRMAIRTTSCLLQVIN